MTKKNDLPAFPDGVDHLSLWRLACRVAGQNPVDTSPTELTLDALQALCRHVLEHGGVQWASVHPDRPPIFRLDGGDAMALIAQMASRPDAMTDWHEVRRKLTLIDVRREDWEQYRQSLADESTQGAIHGAAPSVLAHAGTVLAEEVAASIMDGGEGFVVSADASELGKTGTVRHSTITRRTNILDPEIDNAIKEKGADVNQVFPYLRERALSEEGPFKGVASTGALEYTDANGKVKTLTRDALAKRLNRREEADNGR